MPKVSVCVVAYNHEKYIRQCLQSIVDQRAGFDFEILVGDDFSTDNTRALIREFVEKYPGLVKPIFQSQNIGVTKNYLSVHEAATGEYIAHIDGDDYWYQGKLAQQVNFLDTNKNCTSVYSNAIAVDTDDYLIGVFNNEQPTFIDCGYLLKKGNFLNHSSMMYRNEHKRFILNIEDPLIDYRIHLRLAGAGVIGYINKALVAYRVHQNSMTSKSINSVRLGYFNGIKEYLNDHVQSTNAKSSLEYLMSSVIRSSIYNKDIEQFKAFHTMIKDKIPFNFWLLVMHGFYKSIYRMSLSAIRRTNDWFNGTQNMQILFRR